MSDFILFRFVPTFCFIFGLFSIGLGMYNLNKLFPNNER